MKKILLILLLLKSSIFASSDLNATSLDMFLFKIGFTSLTSEFEDLKTITNQNTNAIEKLQNKLNSINDANLINKISSSIKIHKDTNNDEQTIINLQKKVAILEQKLTYILKQKEVDLKKEIMIKTTNKSFSVKKELPYKYAKVNFNNVKVHYYPRSKSKVTKLLDKYTLIKIQYCNKYHWCKVYKKHEYIAKIRLKF